MYDTFFKYRDAIEQDLKFDEVNIHEASRTLPSKKHFWVAKLIEAKITLKRLENSKSEALKKVQSQVKTGVGLSQSSFAKILNEQEPIKKIDEQIEEWKLIVEYLEKAERVFSQATYDIKNQIEIMKMELM